MANRYIPRQCLRVMDGPWIGSADHPPFHASVLIAQRDFQMEHVFAVALEAKMSGFDDAGVDRPHRHLVNLRPFDAVEVGHAGNQRFVFRPAPGVVAAPVGAVISDGLEPGMALGAKSELFADLALEQMHLRTSRSQRREAVAAHAGSSQPQYRLLIVSQNEVKLHARGVGIGRAEQGHDALIAPNGGEDGLLELLERQFRDGGAVDGPAVGQGW